MDGDKKIEVNFSPKVLVNDPPSISWTIAPSNVAHGQGYSMVAQARDDRAITDLTITKNGVAVGSYLKRELWGKTGDVSTESTDAGPASIVWVATVKDESGASASATAVVTVGAPTPTEEPKKEPPPVGAPSGTITINGLVNCTGRLSGNPGTYAANLAWNTSNVQESTVAISGPGVSINGESSGTQGLSFSGAGTYNYTMTATGLDGSSITRSAAVVVSPAIAPPSGTLSFNFTPASLPVSGGIATAVWSNDGTEQQMGGPQLNASPGNFSGVSQTGSQSYSIPANPTTSPQNYNMVFRGTRADGSSFNIFKTVTVAGGTASYLLRTEVTPSFVLGSITRTPGLLFHTNLTYSTANMWSFSTPQSLGIYLAGNNYPQLGIFPDYELESISVEPASAIERWLDARLDPSNSAYNPRAFGESVANISGTAAVVVRLSPGSPSVTVIARCVKKSAMDVQVSVIPEPNRCTIEPLYAVTAEAKVETNLSGLSYQWVLVDGSGRETAPSSGGSTAKAGFADILPGNYQAKVIVRSSSGAMAVKIVDFNLAPNDLKWPKVELSMDKAKLRPGEPAKLKYIIRSP